MNKLIIAIVIFTADNGPEGMPPHEAPALGVARTSLVWKRRYGCLSWCSDPEKSRLIA